nr:hypothetical transcript [Hymenolepis microstoma]
MYPSLRYFGQLNVTVFQVNHCRNYSFSITFPFIRSITPPLPLSPSLYLSVYYGIFHVLRSAESTNFV